MQTLGNEFLDFAYLPANGTRGGILVAWKPDYITGSDHEIRRFSVTTRFAHGANSWWLTTVYGPHTDDEQVEFLNELRDIRATHNGGWIVMGDFNMIYQACDKNNPNVSRRSMGRFRRAIDDLELRELPLHGRRYTWSNERETPTLERLDHIFCSVDWEAGHPNCFLTCVATL
jgi:exonuclease III